MFNVRFVLFLFKIQQEDTNGIFFLFFLFVQAGFYQQFVQMSV